MKAERRRAIGVVACALGAMLAGCATIYEGKYAFDDGWRKAEIEEVGLASALRGAALSDCRKSATAEQLATASFALLSYADFGHLRRRIVVLPAHTRFEAGDAAYVKLRSCAGDVALQAKSRR